ncbi:MAG: ATP-binding cassette domain-containing protein [Acidobacteriota bacterium]|nr:ATP-binding cassette domain-containing protein [Acidobacteriota bacterium]
MIEVQRLTRRYGDFTAVEDIDFAVDDGEILGVLGPNGAGKTTTIRMITGFLPPTRGRVTVGGIDLVRHPVAARRRIGYLPENVALYDEMRVFEYLRYRGRLEGMARGDITPAIDRALERCFLTEVSSQIISTLSKGFRQRVGLAMAILHDPEVLILDEPTVGLDPKQIIAIRKLIREIGSQRTLLLSTHILPEVELLCDRVVIIDRGRVVAEGTPSGLRDQWVGNARVEVELKDAPADAADALAAIAGVESVRAAAESGRFEIEVADSGIDMREEVFRLAVDRGWILLALTEAEASLEDVFVRLTTHEEPEKDAAWDFDPASEDVS